MKYLALFAMVLLLTGCAAYQQTFVENDPQPPKGKVIVISDYRFHPETAVVNAGDTVTWKNLDRDAHSLEYQNNTSPLLEKDETFSITVTDPGVFEYRSGNHPFIKGRIIANMVNT